MTAGTSARGGLLRVRDFRLLWLGETTSMVGSSVASVALPLVAVVVLHTSTFVTALLTAIAWLPWLLVGLPAGAWVDRWPKRPVMLLCNTVSMAVFASVPLVAWLGALTVTHLLAAAFLGGVAKVFFGLAYRAYLPTLVGTDQLLEANTKLQGSESAAQIAGPGLAGLFAQAFGAVAGVLADAISFGISVLCLRSIRAREPRREAAKRSRLRTEIADGLRFVAHDRYLRVLALFGATSNIGLMGYHSIEVVFLARNLHASPAAIGVVLALGGVGGVLGALVAGKIARRFGNARGFLLCEAFVAPILLVGPLAGGGAGLVFFVVAVFGLEAGITASNIMTVTFRQQYCPPELFGRIMASTAALNYGAIPLGALLGGFLGEVAGVRDALWLMAGFQFLAVAVLLLSPFRPLRDLPAAADRPST